ncbi:hypothetical protein GSI_13391 [Ganoderma sinense ZZ0214-1]|uniref:Uncharacterized protein n=1 Tax=Ganoderma sinense ZZ0214-1 TaxID=1077348 RepID=A0A2G8RVG1_9APHY|nr:hypothetical protein GSI_13391 [Ganoderma sinense ZZ0214-1]
MRPLCWLLVGRIFAPRLPLGEAPAQPAEPLNEDITMGAVVPAQDFQDDISLDAELNMSNVVVGFNHSGSDPAPRGQVHSTRNGYLNGYETVHEGDIQQPSGSALNSTVIDSELQEVRYTTLGSDSCTIHFGRQGEGIPLSAVNTLDDHSFAFEQGSSLNIKASLRFRFRYWLNISELGDHVDRRKQVNIRHSNKEGPPISLRAMARLVLSELMAEMVSFPIDDLVLIRVERVKFGTLQPIFRLRR